MELRETKNLQEIKGILSAYCKAGRDLRMIGGIDGTFGGDGIQFFIDDLIECAKENLLDIEVHGRKSAKLPWGVTIPDLNIFAVANDQDMERHGLKQRREGTVREDKSVADS